jgi:acyl-CoA thioester hydrolase
MPRIYERTIIVDGAHTDALGHVNNEVYLSWFVEAAGAHSAANGWPQERYLRTGAGWVVRKHEIEYLAQAFPRDTLVLRTWVATMGASSSLRRYELTRDAKKIATGATNWVWIDFKTGRPTRIPADVAESFEVVELA